jgi:hypothetical protein
MGYVEEAGLKSTLIKPPRNVDVAKLCIIYMIRVERPVFSSGRRPHGFYSGSEAIRNYFIIRAFLWGKVPEQWRLKLVNSVSETDFMITVKFNTATDIEVSLSVTYFYRIRPFTFPVIRY